MSSCRAFVSEFLCVSLAALSSFACDDGNATRIGPSSVQTDARFVSRSVTVTPDLIAAVPVPGAFCPAVSPFLLPLSLVIRADGATDLFLREVQMQFFDAAGTRGAFRTINGPELSTLFGSTLIPAFGSRTFPVSLPFGCIGGHTGNLAIQVVAFDRLGVQAMNSLLVPVR